MAGEVEQDQDGSIAYTVDLNNCDREPIQHISAVQPVGFLIAVDEDWLISRLSAKTTDHLHQPVKTLLGAPLAGALAPEIVHERRRTSFCRSALD